MGTRQTGGGREPGGAERASVDRRRLAALAREAKASGRDRVPRWVIFACSAAVMLDVARFAGVVEWGWFGVWLPAVLLGASTAGFLTSTRD